MTCFVGKGIKKRETSIDLSIVNKIAYNNNKYNNSGSFWSDAFNAVLKYAVLQFSADLVTFTEEILNGKIFFLCNAIDTSTVERLVCRMCRSST